MVGARHKFFSSQHGPVAALRVLSRDGAGIAGAFQRHEAIAILRELAADSRRGERSDLVALSGLVEVGLATVPLRVPTTRLLQGLIAAVDGGRLVLLRGWNATESAVKSPEERAEQQLVASAMGGAGEIAFEGERYLLMTAAAWRQFPDQQYFEIVRADAAGGVLQRLAARPRRTAGQKTALKTVATRLAAGGKNGKDGDAGEGLLLLRRGSFATAYFPEEAAGSAATPSQMAKTEKSWIEIEVLDDKKKPYQGRYVLELPDGRKVEGTLDGAGGVRVDGIDPGQCKISFPDADKSAVKKA